MAITCYNTGHIKDCIVGLIKKKQKNMTMVIN
jgi:hypothetical protein